MIAALGRDPKAISIPIPENVRVERFIPFHQIMPKVDVFVTNGGYGSVNHALSEGVPIVIAGTTDDKAFTSARVEWTGAGINLKTDTPSVDQIKEAVQALLKETKYRKCARALQADFAKYKASKGIAETVASLLV